MQISLYNSASLVRNSSQFTENGEHNNQVWCCPLAPEEWTLSNNWECGRIEVALYRYDGNNLYTEEWNCSILVLPEQLDVTLSSYTFKNETDGRMDHLNASYRVTSVQDPSFHHPGLCFSCEIFDGANVLLYGTDFNVSAGGFLDLIIDKEHLELLEGQKLLVKTQPTTLIEPVTIETDMIDIVDRTDFLLYYRNLTESYDGGAVSIWINFELGNNANWSGALEFPLYYEWTVSNTTGAPFQNGSAFVQLGEPLPIELEAGLTPLLEHLILDLRFEGNFFFKPKHISLALYDQVTRKEVSIELANLGEILATGVGDLLFQLKEGQANSPVTHHPVKFLLANETTGGQLSAMTCTSDGNGCAPVTLSEGMLRDLEHVSVAVQSLANLSLKESVRVFLLRDYFQRMSPSLRVNNASFGLTLISNKMNVLSMSVLVDGDFGLFMDKTAMITFFNDEGAVIQQGIQLVGQGGSISCAIPVHALREGMVVRVSVVVEATLVSKQLTAEVSFHVEAMLDPEGTAKIQAWTVTTVLLVSVIGAMISIKCVKRVRQGLLSKDQFTITVA